MNETMNARDIVKDMTYAELEAIEQACQQRLMELRVDGVIAVAAEIERLAAEKLGMSAKELMSAARKMNKEKTAAAEAAE